MSNAVELPVLNEAKCTHCGECVEACPSHCLEFRARVWLARPADCISCSACALVCPEDAVTMGSRQ